MEQKYSRGLGVLRKSIIGTLVGLGLEFLLGMIVNLYVQFPANSPNGNVFTWVTQHSTLTMIHILLGTVILVLGLFNLILTTSMQGKVAIITSIVGFVSILFSWGSGMAFLTNGQQNMMSLDMSIGFILSVFVYGYQLRLLRAV